MTSAIAPNQSPRLQVESLACAHGGPYDLTLAAGECVAVGGRSGSGKSVLLRMIADLDPHTGEVRLDGRACSSWPAPTWRRHVVYHAAEPAWWAPTAREHFGADGCSRVEALLPRLDLDPALLDADITRLSTGERQRLALIRSLARSPRVLLLDEPTSALDHAGTSAVERLLAECVGLGLSVLWVTHTPEQAVRIGHRHVEIRERRLHAS
ncbi:MAG: ATP-binding cassette domain-containing protein [Proteobacteria bacterium]|nr:ATP-binding cassette domain-containing protein [Pseudomonadota bacterium]